MILAGAELVEKKAILAESGVGLRRRGGPPNVNCAMEGFPQNWP